MSSRFKVGDFITLENCIVKGVYKDILKGRVAEVKPYKNDWMADPSYIVWVVCDGGDYEAGVDEDNPDLRRGLMARLKYVGVKLGLIIP